MHFETIGFQGKYRELTGDPCVVYTAMIYGLPKSSKSTLCIDFAKCLTEHHGRVIEVWQREMEGLVLGEGWKFLGSYFSYQVISSAGRFL